MATRLKSMERGQTMSEERHPPLLDERQKQLIRETLAGYAAANEYLEQERKERLAHLTPEKARAMADAVNACWKPLDMNDPGVRRMEEWRLETKLKVRRAFYKLAQAQGLIPASLEVDDQSSIIKKD